MSAGEQRAWIALRALREHGVHVIRQHKVGRYTLDFAIRKHRIAIEIDGAVHDFPGRADYDEQRQVHLESKGWRFVRIRSERTHDAAHVLAAVMALLPPSPSRGGGRGWGEAPTSVDLDGHPTAKASKYSVTPRPLTPSPQGEGELPAHIKRRTRANRVLKPRRAS